MQVSGYLAAFVPGAAIFLSSHIHALYRTPLAMSFVLIGAVARTFGRGPSILSPIVTALCFNYVIALPEFGWSVNEDGLVETSIILVLGFAIAYLFRGQRPNGEIRWLGTSGAPKPSDPSIWIGLTMDITNRKTAELALIRSEKLLVTSRLASSVSHEINNPLEAITNLIYLPGSLEPDIPTRRSGRASARRLFHRRMAAPCGPRWIAFFMPESSTGRKRQEHCENRRLDFRRPLNPSRFNFAILPSDLIIARPTPSAELFRLCPLWQP